MKLTLKNPIFWEDKLAFFSAAIRQQIHFPTRVGLILAIKLSPRWTGIVFLWVKFGQVLRATMSVNASGCNHFSLEFTCRLASVNCTGRGGISGLKLNDASFVQGQDLRSRRCWSYDLRLRNYQIDVCNNFINTAWIICGFQFLSLWKKIYKKYLRKGKLTRWVPAGRRPAAA